MLARKDCRLVVMSSTCHGVSWLRSTPRGEQDGAFNLLARPSQAVRAVGGGTSELATER